VLGAPELDAGLPVESHQQKKHLTRDAVDLQIAALLFYRKTSYSTRDAMTIKTVLHYYVTVNVSHFKDVRL